MSRYLDLFVQETTEHVEAIGQRFVELGRAHDPEAVDAVFRHAHSVKGMAASMGFGPIGELAHRLEDLMDVVRAGRGTLSQDDVDLGLAVADALTSLVDLAAQGADLRAAPVDVVALSTRLAEARGRMVGEKRGPKPGIQGMPAPSLETGPQPPTSIEDASPAALPPPESARPAAQASPSGPRPTLRVTVKVAGTSKVPGVRGFLVHKRLGSLGEVVGCDPSLAELKAGQMPENRLEILLATTERPEVVDRALDTISELTSVKVEEIRAEDLLTPTVRATAAAVPQTPRRGRTVRIRTDLLDAFMDSVGELLLATDRIRGLLPARSLDAPDPLEDAVDGLAKVVGDLNRQVMATRMTPLATLTDRLPRLVRGLARQLGKEVSLLVDGGEIELDRAILDEMDAPLTHLVRNCIDHGLESPEERKAAGKTHSGRLRFSARRDRDRVVIQVSDDGRGLDRERLKQLAIASGRLEPSVVEQLSDREVVMLVCMPGLSTSEVVSDVSGRGVGMDVVRDTVESLGGSLEIETAPGEGTTFTLQLPLTIAIQRLLLVGAGDEIYGIPVAKVVHVTEIAASQQSRARGQTMVPFLHGLVPSFDLGSRLGEGAAGGEMIPHVVFEAEGRDVAALAVDRLAGHLEALIKPLEPPLDGIRGLSGVTVLPDGRPIFVLDLASLVRRSEHRGGA